MDEIRRRVGLERHAEVATGVAVEEVVLLARDEALHHLRTAAGTGDIGRRVLDRRSRVGHVRHHRRRARQDGQHGHARDHRAAHAAHLAAAQRLVGEALRRHQVGGHRNGAQALAQFVFVVHRSASAFPLDS